jgi:hypothetical protein
LNTNLQLLLKLVREWPVSELVSQTFVPRRLRHSEQTWTVIAD